MSLLNIIYYPNNKLRKKNNIITKVNNKIINIVNNMFDTMYKYKGIGLSSTQVDIKENIIILDISKKQNKPIILINPLILYKKGKIKSNEGCLSIPGYYNFITRSKYIKVEALNIYGVKYELEVDNLLSICIQHEIDHLNGILFIDYLSSLKLKRFNKKFKKNKKYFY